MDERTDRDLGQVLRSASEDASRIEHPSMVSVAAELRTQIMGPGDPLHEIVVALEYYPIEGCEHLLLDVQTRPKSCTCAPASGPADERALPLWAQALAYAPRPLLGARFADLLWSARYGDAPHEWAQRAIDAYLAAVYDEFGHPLEIAEGLQRALVLASEIDDRPRTAAVTAALIGLVDRSLVSAARSSGVVLSIIESLAGQAPTERPTELPGLVERALDHYGNDAWLLESTLDIKARLVEPCERRQLHVDQVDAFAGLARRNTGPLRHPHFEHAIEVAEHHDLTDLAGALRIELVEAPAEPVELDIDLTRPEDAVTDFVDRIVGADSLNESLARFGASLPTEGFSGTINAAEAERLAYFGVLAVDLLTRTREQYGPVSDAGVWLECPLIGPTIASRLAHGIELYELGDFDGAASVLAPRLEWIVRSVANAAGVVDVGSDLTINDVLIALAGALYEPSRRYLRELLPRTAVTATARDAALLVHAACHLRLLQPVEASGYTGTVNATV